MLYPLCDPYCIAPIEMHVPVLSFTSFKWETQCVMKHGRFLCRLVLTHVCVTVDRSENNTSCSPGILKLGFWDTDNSPRLGTHPEKLGWMACEPMRSTCPHRSFASVAGFYTGVFWWLNSGPCVCMASIHTNWAISLSRQLLFSASVFTSDLKNGR